MVVNEFIKSIARTLGRIAAYIVLGILAYFIFTWFNADEVKALSTNSNPQYLSLFNYSDRIGLCSYTQGGYNGAYCLANQNLPNNTPFTSVWYEWDMSQEPIQNGKTYDYEIFTWVVFTIPINNPTANILATFQVQQSIGSTIVDVTCDKDCLYEVSDYGTGTYYQLSGVNRVEKTGTRYLIHMKGQVTVVGNYTRLSFKIWDGPYMANVYAYPNITFFEHGTDNEALINSMRENFNRLIWEQSQNHYQTIEALEGLAEAEASLNEDITSEEPADINILTGIQTLMPSNTPVTDIITLPLNILNKEIQSLGGTCQAWTINTGSLLGNNTWTFPCLNIGQYFTGYSYSGYNLWQLIDLMISLFMGYKILMLIIHSYNKIANLDDTFNSLYTTKG